MDTCVATGRNAAGGTKRRPPKPAHARTVWCQWARFRSLFVRSRRSKDASCELPQADMRLAMLPSSKCGS
eukprot:scaffold670_cov333-Pavlova_lutheri.AAC.31